MLTANQLAIESKVADVLCDAKQKFPACLGLEIDRIVWKAKGRAVGMASYNDNKFFLTFTKEASQDGIFFDDTMNDTVAHEVAHLVIMYFKKCGLYHGRKIMPHGKEWRRVAIALGSTGKRCHNLPITTARVHTKYMYRLNNGNVILIGKKHHNAIHDGRVIRMKSTQEQIHAGRSWDRHATV